MKRSLMIFVSSLLILAAGATAEQEQEVLDTTWVIKSADMAMVRALEYTGFDRADYKKPAKVTDAVKTAVLHDDVTPFLSERINGKTLWQVTFDSVYLDLPGYVPSYIENQERKTFRVYLEPETGRLLKIISDYDGSNPDLADEPPAEFAEQYMGGETYDDFLDGAPEVDFYKACKSATPSYPATADQVIAVCVMHTTYQYKERPVWCIQGRGIPPFDGSSLATNTPVCERNRLRSCVDAVSGQLIKVTNRPHVVSCDKTSDTSQAEQ